MDVKTHWENVYKTKPPETVSWYRPHLETSLTLIERTGAGLSSSIIDVGGGESTLPDDLASRGYQNVTVLEVSETAIEVCRNPCGQNSRRARCPTHEPHFKHRFMINQAR
jgi:2-polyprenyl-3-methyl-5-hydroxy-6-metoxy-1,4-benzoquinol methylase